MENAKVGMHSYCGACDPRAYPSRLETFSVGVFEWIAKSRGGVKKGKVKVRVSGRTSNPDAVYAAADKIAALLDSGKYDGPKTVKLV